jgi:hypothetical protein
VDYPAGYSLAGFVWGIFQTTAPAASIQASLQASARAMQISRTDQRVTARASSAVFGTSSNIADLGPQQLSTGTYLVAVVAVGTSEDISPVSQGNVTLVLSGDLSDARVYPNPWRADRHASKPVTFDMLPIDATVKIFTVSGHWVKTLPPGPTTTWDLNTDSGDKVASGLYIYLINSGSGKKTGQIAVIK